MLEWILQYWVGLAFGILSGALAGLWRQFRAYKRATLVSLRHIIVTTYNVYISREYIPIHELENVTEAYNAYKLLVRDSAMEKLYHDITQLPSKRIH